MARVTDKIEFTSPSGLVFSGKWIGGEITGSKKVAVFEYPSVNGATVQDWGVNSSKIPLDFWFDGDGHTIVGRNFRAALSEKGKWNVKHPVHGAMLLQPVEFTIDDQPVKSKTNTAVKTQWILAIPESKQSPVLTREAIQEIARKTMSKAGAALDELTKKGSIVESIKSFFKTVMKKIRSIMDTIFQINNEARKKINQAFKILDTVLNAPFLVVGTLLSAVTTILAIPGQVGGMVKTKVAMYRMVGKAIREVGRDLSSGGVATIGSADAQRMIATVNMMSLCSGVTTGEVLSRDESFSSAENLWREYVDMVNADDALVKELPATLLKNSYFGNLQFEEIGNVVGRTIGLMISDQYSSAIKRTISVIEDVSTMAFSIEHYPDREIDDGYNFLIDTNSFSGDKIVVIPAGTDVVVYI